MKQKKFTPAEKKDSHLTTSSQNFKIILTDNFRKEAKRLADKYPHIKEDFFCLRDTLQKDPITGNEALGRDLFKVRMAIADKNKGQSGGARVIIQVKIIDKIVYLLSVYDKSDKENLIDKELVKLLKESGLI